jgi:hypothetical protein
VQFGFLSISITTIYHARGNTTNDLNLSNSRSARDSMRTILPSITALHSAVRRRRESFFPRWRNARRGCDSARW